MAYQAEEVFKKHNIPIITSEKLEIKWIEGQPYVSRNQLILALGNVEVQNKSEARALEEESIQKIINEYREERKKIKK